MALALNRVHELGEIDGRSVIKRTRPAMRVKFDADAPPVWIQNGTAYYENGEPVRDPPRAFLDHLATLDPAALKAAGWEVESKRGPGRPRKPREQPEEQTNGDNQPG